MESYVSQILIIHISAQLWPSFPSSIRRGMISETSIVSSKSRQPHWNPFPNSNCTPVIQISSYTPRLRSRESSLKGMHIHTGPPSFILSSQPCTIQATYASSCSSSTYCDICLAFSGWKVTENIPSGYRLACRVTSKQDGENSTGHILENRNGLRPMFTLYSQDGWYSSYHHPVLRYSRAYSSQPLIPFQNITMSTHCSSLLCLFESGKQSSGSLQALETKIFLSFWAPQPILGLFTDMIHQTPKSILAA